jgi:hypothetical protein
MACQMLLLPVELVHEHPGVKLFAQRVDVVADIQQREAIIV